MQDNYVKIFKEMQRHVYVLGVLDQKAIELTVLRDVARGTAFAVSKEGHFLTAFHLIEDDYDDIKKNKKVVGLMGMHGHGVNDEPAFRVDVIEVYPKYDMALLKGKSERDGFIPTSATMSLPGAWIATIGYPLSYYEPSINQVIVGKRFVSAMISRGILKNGVRMVELDKHLSHGHSGGPIMGLSGAAFGLATAYDIGWTKVKESINEGGEIKEVNRFFQLPVQFSKGALIYNIATELRKQGVPVITN